MFRKPSIFGEFFIVFLLNFKLCLSLQELSFVFFSHNWLISIVLNQNKPMLVTFSTKKYRVLFIL